MYKCIWRIKTSGKRQCTKVCKTIGLFFFMSRILGHICYERPLWQRWKLSFAKDSSIQRSSLWTAGQRSGIKVIQALLWKNFLLWDGLAPVDNSANDKEAYLQFQNKWQSKCRRDRGHKAGTLFVCHTSFCSSCDKICLSIDKSR